MHQIWIENASTYLICNLSIEIENYSNLIWSVCVAIHAGRASLRIAAHFIAFVEEEGEINETDLLLENM